ncbi:hypothetical protein SBA1_290018 [Candidatus Sulfotelmatobacter kueseliae]|uniref:Uncharacterized protein n=1 Tax=Candidatus Sulfotelmatobacter kueseliae TaxID=2042962 RepID=A0A2U3KJ38_9BACT|nr:hypothetical protein SBA1_290018 [Candidatus Sulfotelmatobacter kueseliae]
MEIAGGDRNGTEILTFWVGDQSETDRTSSTERAGPTSPALWFWGELSAAKTATAELRRRAHPF